MRKFKLSARRWGIVQLLLSQDNYIPISTIQNKFNVSQRTVYYEIDHINEILMENKIEPIQHVRNGGFYLVKAAKPQVKNLIGTFDMNGLTKKLSQQQRVGNIIWTLCISDEKNSISKLMNQNHTSRNTTIADIQKVRHEVSKYGLSVEGSIQFGHKLVGRETDIRQLMLKYMQKNISDNAGIQKIIEIITSLNCWTKTNYKFLQTEIRHWLNESNAIIKKTYSEYSIGLLSVFLPIVLKRMFLGHRIEEGDVDKYLIDLPEHQYVYKFLGKFNEILNEDDPEVYYVEKLLLGSQLGNYTQTNISLHKKLFDITFDVIKKFQYLSGSSFQNAADLRKRLYTHLLACYYRLKYGIEYHHGFLEEVKNNYQDIFILTRESVKSFEEFSGHKLNDDELSLIAIYFGGEIKKKREDQEEPVVVLLVCSNGIGTSEILKQQLKSYYPFVVFKGPVTEHSYLQKKHIDSKLVISTMKIPMKDVPTIIVSPVLSEEDKVNLSRILSPYDFSNKYIVNQLINGILDIAGDYIKYKDIR